MAGGRRQIPFLNGEVREEGPTGPEGAAAVLPGKTSKYQAAEAVPQTNTGGRIKNIKALERTREKELGKIVP